MNYEDKRKLIHQKHFWWSPKYEEDLKRLYRGETIEL